MKKYVSLGLVVSILLVLASLPASGCTTIIVGKELTMDNSTLLAHNEDMGFESIGRLWSVPAGIHEKNATVNVPYETLPCPEKTYQYWASGNTIGAKGLGITEVKEEYKSVLVGMNEYGVAMACNWVDANSKEGNVEKKGVNRYAIRELLLGQCKTAREAVEFVGNIIDKYGQADWGGLIYCIADPEEGWVVETTTHHWVAKRVPDNAIYAIANRYTIEENFDMGSKDLLEFAKANGWYKENDGPFNFKKVYGNPDVFEDYDIKRESRVHELLKGKEGTICPEDLFIVLRDRYEHTEDYVKPQTEEVWRDYCQSTNIARTICTNICQSSSVAQLRRDMPREIGSILWYSMATPAYSGYFPLYAGASKIPQEYSKPTSEETLDSAFWVFRNLQRYGDKNYETLSTIALNHWNSNYAILIARIATFESLLQKQIINDKETAMELINTFTFRCANYVLQEGRVLLEKFKNVTHGGSM